MLATAHRPQQNTRALLVAALGVLLGALLWRAPALLSAVLVLGAVLLPAALRWPLLPLALALLAGPFKALLAVTYPALPDPAQLLLGLALLAWLLRGLAQRRLQLPTHSVALLLILFLVFGGATLLAAQDLRTGAAEWAKWLQVLLVMALVAAEPRRSTPWLLAALLLSGATQAVVGNWQFALRGYGPEHYSIAPGLFRAYGGFEQPNPFGGYMGLVWPLAAALAAGLWPARQIGRHARRAALGAAGSRAAFCRAQPFAAFGCGAHAQHHARHHGGGYARRCSHQRQLRGGGTPGALAGRSRNGCGASMAGRGVGQLRSGLRALPACALAAGTRPRTQFLSKPGRRDRPARPADFCGTAAGSCAARLARAAQRQRLAARAGAGDPGSGRASGRP